MGKRMDIGVSDKARKGKKGCIGIDNVARKIKKMWIGVGNVARLFFSGQGQLTYHGVITPLTSARYMYYGVGAGLSMKNHALICGGYYNADVDAYDKDLVHSTATSLSNASATWTGSAKIGNYGLVATGVINLDVFDEDLVLSNTISLESARTSIAITPFKNHAVFFGGSGYLTTIEVFDENLSKSVYELVEKRSEAGASFNSKYAIVAGGRWKTSGYRATTEALDENFTLVAGSNLVETGTELVGGNVGDYAIFAGNQYQSASSGLTVQAFDSNLTRVELANLPALYDTSDPRSTPLNVEGYAMFWAGEMVGNNTYANVVAYDELLVQQTLTAPTNKLNSLAGSATVGEYAIFAGGRVKVNASSYSNSAIAEAYKLV